MYFEVGLDTVKQLRFYDSIMFVLLKMANQKFKFL